MAAVAADGLSIAVGEGGLQAADGVCSVEPHGRTQIAIIGGTGYVGRLLARRLLSHPTFCLGPIVGSKRSEGMLFQEVWESKEAALLHNYGNQLWSAMAFPPQLRGLLVSSLEELLRSDCKYAISCVAPEVGYIEDILTSQGMKVFSISPYKRAQNLMVLEVNPTKMLECIDQSLFKSPNCISVGSCLALKALEDVFGLEEVSVCTLQSLSGRGDAMYPAELVQGNIYPVWGTKEPTETYIGNEIRALIDLKPEVLSVRAHRVGVHIGHFADIRVKVKAQGKLVDEESVYAAFEAFAPLEHLAGVLPSLPPKPLVAMRQAGAPRPNTHQNEYGGMAVAVGNVKLNDGQWDICFSVVVNNMVRGAYGAALLMAEYYAYLKDNPHAVDALSYTLNSRQTAEEASVHAAETLEAPTPEAKVNTLNSRAACDAVAADPAAFHAAFARSRLHWHHPQLRAWLRYDEPSGEWRGWRDVDGDAVTLGGAAAAHWSPWTAALDSSQAPLYDWFVGAETNAAFNEVDRHVLSGHGDELAAVHFGKASVDAACSRGSVMDDASSISRAQLLYRSVVAAKVLTAHGISMGARVVLHLPVSIEQLVWIQACKRLGVIYVCVPSTLSMKALADRIFDCGAALVITSNTISATTGIKLKVVAQRAVADFLPLEPALEAVRSALGSATQVDPSAASEMLEVLQEGLGEKPVVELREVLSKLQMIFLMHRELRKDATLLGLRVQDALSAKQAGARILVLVGGDLDLYPISRDAVPGAACAPWASTSNTPSSSGGSTPAGSHDGCRPSANGTGDCKTLSRYKNNSDSNLSAQGLPARNRNRSDPNLKVLGTSTIHGADAISDAERAVLLAAGAASADELLRREPGELVRSLWASVPPAVVDNKHPLMVVYTSGTSGRRPRGLVFSHGGFAAGAMLTMETCFDVRPGTDVVHVRAAPSWITGQTYSITGPLCTRSTSAMVSAPLDYKPSSLAAIVKQLGVTIFIASAAFPKLAMPNSEQHAWFEGQCLGSTLRVAAACGEPLSPAVHRLGMSGITRHFRNSYWATEHGGIVLAHTYGNADQSLRSDSHMFPLPWTGAAVWVPEAADGRRLSVAQAGQQLPCRYREAAADGSEKGLLVCTKPWPAMARTVWGSADRFGEAGWAGDLDAFEATYFSSFVDSEGRRVPALNLGDLAHAWADGSISVIGRQHEMLDVGDRNVAVADIESSILQCEDVIDCIVVPVADADSGTDAPVAVLTLRGADQASEALTGRLRQVVYEEHGEYCVPIDFVLTTAIPRTFSSKPMRQLVRQLFAGARHGDMSEMANPSCMVELTATIANWLSVRAAPVLDEYC